jgi:hypothetical protein
MSNLLLRANCHSSLHTHGKEYGGKNDYKWLDNIELVHVNVVAKHVKIAGNVCTLIPPCQLGPNNQQQTPSSKYGKESAAREFVVAHYALNFVATSWLSLSLKVSIELIFCRGHLGDRTRVVVIRPTVNLKSVAHPFRSVIYGGYLML